MPLFDPPGFTGSPLVRTDMERDNQPFLEAAIFDPKARLLRLDGLAPVVEPDGGLSWASLAEADPEAPLALLGLIDGAPRFVSLSRIAHRGPDQRMSMINRSSAMPPGDAATYAAARSLVDWHDRHRFCANCGRLTTVRRSGWARFCLRGEDGADGGCGAEHFPRTDPVVIMLAEHEGRVLVGRNVQAQGKFYSALAGFLEVGESMEDAVARELFEEAGVIVTSVRYITSQPWPMPSQLMMGCIATVESDVLNIDRTELNDAIWVGRDEVLAALAGEPDAPFHMRFPLAIAYTLLTAWVNGA